MPDAMHEALYDPTAIVRHPKKSKLAQSTDEFVACPYFNSAVRGAYAGFHN